ncbi:hypothetical protein cand_002350 [Cryptosporidium andersoni]|uniref:Uncharacterized protein n=1 Tax=Cryptosporidium andersoni TaxID=117008 RepID=A0A1J4MP02_9CRYT|nr:hypothetical protein cand_002350 [Cryptosporidium andersoni]
MVISESLSEIHRTLQKSNPLNNPKLDFSEILTNCNDIESRKRRWKGACCHALECISALSHLSSTNVDELSNGQELLKLEDNLSERRQDIEVQLRKLNRDIDYSRTQLNKIIEDILTEISILVEDYKILKHEFSQKTSNIPFIIEEGARQQDENFSDISKTGSVDDIRNLQKVGDGLLSEIEKQSKEENKISDEIKELELQWSSCRQKNQRLENEILLRKTEATCQETQVEAHINSRLSRSSNYGASNENLNQLNRRNSIAKWIGRLSCTNDCNKYDKEIIEEDENEDIEGELEVLNLLSIVKVNDHIELNEINGDHFSTPNSYKLYLKIDPSPCLDIFLDPNFDYPPELKLLNTEGIKEISNESLFSNGPLELCLNSKGGYGFKTFQEIELSENSCNTRLSQEEIAMFNIFVGELKKNENIPISSIGKLLCSTLK